MSFDAARWAKVRHHLMQHADRLEHDACRSGAMNDGGAYILRDKVKVFEAGLQGQIPADWERIVAPLLDPEYAEYQRLKAKFERRQD